MGIPTYDHSYLVNKSAALTDKGGTTSYPKFESEQSRGGSSEGLPGADVCEVPAGYLAGVFNFWGLEEDKLLDGTGQPFQGIHYRCDECSQTVRSGNNRCLPPVGPAQDVDVISPMFTMKPCRSWFRPMIQDRLERRGSPSRTVFWRFQRHHNHEIRAGGCH